MPDLNRDHVNSVWCAGPQPRACEFSVARRTSTAKWSERRMSERLEEVLSERISEDLSKGLAKICQKGCPAKDLSERMCQKEYQTKYQKERQKICQKESEVYVNKMSDRMLEYEKMQEIRCMSYIFHHVANLRNKYLALKITLFRIIPTNHVRFYVNLIGGK